MGCSCFRSLTTHKQKTFDIDPKFVMVSPIPNGLSLKYHKTIPSKIQSQKPIIVKMQYFQADEEGYAIDPRQKTRKLTQNQFIAQSSVSLPVNSKQNPTGQHLKDQALSNNSDQLSNCSHDSHHRLEPHFQLRIKKAQHKRNYSEQICKITQNQETEHRQQPPYKEELSHYQKNSMKQVNISKHSKKYEHKFENKEIQRDQNIYDREQNIDESEMDEQIDATDLQRIKQKQKMMPFLAQNKIKCKSSIEKDEPIDIQTNEDAQSRATVQFDH